METRDDTRLWFTEEMKGFVAFGEEDARRGYAHGRELDNRLMFHLTIEVDGVHRFADDPRHEAEARGWVRCEALGGKLPVSRGVFNLFVDTDSDSEKRMLYRLHFTDGVGHPITLTGHKVIRNDPGLDLWPDTTTLFTRLLRGHVDSDGEDGSELIASGVLRVQKLDFARQLTTFRASGPTLAAAGAALVRFGRLFMGHLWRIYGRRPVGA